MKLCITATGKDIDVPVDPAFGRARYFLWVDSETPATEALENHPGAHGAGVQAAQTMVDHEAGVVLTGNVGPNALRGLAAASIEVFVGATGPAREAVTAYQAGELQHAGEPTIRRHVGGRRER